MSKVAAFSPAGVKSWIELRDNILNVKQLKQRAVDALPWTPDIRLSTPLSKCKFLPTSTIHLVLKVHGESGTDRLQHQARSQSKENLWLSLDDLDDGKVYMKV